MWYKGQKWRITSKVVNLPETFNNQGYGTNYVVFGRVCNESRQNALKTTRVYPSRNNAPVFAFPIECDGHSADNIMYGKDGYKYLMLEGKVYLRKFNKKGKVIQ